ncbi:MAG: rod shape-determining protein RodA [Calditrichaceae bacterium]
MNKSFLTKLDFALLSTVLILLTIGLIAVYSATYSPDIENNSYFEKQLTFAVFGLILLLVTSFMPFRVIQKMSYPLYIISIILLILVMFFGVRGFGAERWLSIGPLKLQPSEFAKIATVLAVARYLSTREANVNRFKYLAGTSAIILLPFVLIVQQPDLGTSLVFLVILIPLVYWAGLSWFALFVILFPLATVLLSFNFYTFLIWMAVVLFILLLSKRSIYISVAVFLIHISVGMITPALWGQLKPYQQQRILTFANPEADPKGAGYQIIQSQVAIGSGGIWGKGFLEGSQTHLKFLPAQHTDFIFSVIGEEWGFTGIVFVLSIFLVLLLYMLHLGTIVRSKYSSIVIIGVMTILFFHIFINIGMTAGLAPVTGLPLPFISYGGSFLISTLLMIGIVMNLSVNRYLD